MLNMTTLQLARLVINTDLFHLGHTMELQASNGIVFNVIYNNIALLYSSISKKLFNSYQIDTGAAVKKSPPPVIFLHVAVSHISVTESQLQPSVVFESDSVSHIFNDWRRLSLDLHYLNTLI